MSGAVPTTSGDPWAWLLGRTPAGGWRHAPFRAVDPGQGQDPSLEPRVEVIRRLIAYPPRAFAALVAAIAAADRDPRHPIQWVCHRSSGDAPARPYWLSFLRGKESGGRRFYVAIELFDRERLGLWFLSGFKDEAVPRQSKAPFPDNPKVSLPRFEVTDDTAPGLTQYGRWIQLAFHDALLSFASGGEHTTLEGPDALTLDPVLAAQPMPAPSAALRQGGLIVDQSMILDSAAAAASAALRREIKTPSGRLVAQTPASHGTGSAPTAAPEREDPPDVRNARARLVICPPGRAAEIVPLYRLTTIVGRDLRCDLVIDDRSVSGEHARLVYREGVPTIEDMGSKNGTRVGVGVVRKASGPKTLSEEVLIGLGRVPCLFVKDAEDTIPPGEKRPPRQRARLEELVAHGRLSRDVADRATNDARARGITPAEVLVSQGSISPEEWTNVPKLGASSSGCVVIFFLLVLAGMLAGCTSFALPPFYEQRIDEGETFREGEREVTWDEDLGLHPLFQVRHADSTGPIESDTGYPPATPQMERTEVHWLFPMGLYEKKGNDKRIHFYPFYLRDVRTDPDGFEHKTTVAFPPGLFTGSDPVHGDFAYLFPFGGNMYGLFGKDEIYGVLFPLYAFTRDRGVETHHLLFPLMATWSGGDEKAQQEGFRILPFYGHQKKVNHEGTIIFERHTVLWPFINWVHEGKNSRNPFDSVFIFPFFGITRSDWKDDTTVLWPFFRYWHDKQKHYEEWRFPFPFLIYGSEDDTEGAESHTRFDLWPLFGVRKRTDSYFRQFVLWPFERYERQETDDYTDTRFWFAPFLFTMSREGKKSDWSERKTRLWPLFKYDRRKNGDFEVRALDPWFFDDPRLDFDTILYPLFRLFRYVTRHDGSSELDLLLGLFSTRTKANGETRWDVFGGLVGHGTSPAGEGKVRLFWLLDF